MKTEHFDLVILGAGSAGLVVAAVAAGLGYKTALLEGAEMGGDCLNYGCVPSKALLAAAHKAYAAAHLDKLGIRADVQVDFAKVMAHVHAVIAAIAPHDSEERFSGLGVTVIREHGQLKDAHTIVTPTRTLTGRRIVIATGARAFVPPIEGLANVPYLTNETVFSLTEQPKHLLVMGGGPIGAELGQAFRRLGSKVTIIEAAPRILGKDDPELAEVVRSQLLSDGITLHEGKGITAVKGRAGSITLTLSDGTQVDGSHLLVAAGRAPNVENLGLDAAGIDHTAKGIPTNKAMQTNKKHIFAIGDVTGPYQFTHMAGYQAGLVIRRSLFGSLTTKADYRAVPWVTYTSPELAGIGMTEAQARATHGDSVRTVTVPLAQVDRAQAEKDTNGMLKVITTKSGKVLGATLVGTQAGELIHAWAPFIQFGLPIRRMNDLIVAYPTRSDVHKRAASAYYKDALYAPTTRRISRLLFKLLG
ncbi:MAG: dihydrolipoamide dehydrogenase [Proteobacteria bacterium]|nr:dihydrolipoamide dehydrogenase [Pseudomonadota bacterium]